MLTYPFLAAILLYEFTVQKNIYKVFGDIRKNICIK